jgi:hypothetical protein
VPVDPLPPDLVTSDEPANLFRLGRDPAREMRRKRPQRVISGPACRCRLSRPIGTQSHRKRGSGEDRVDDSDEPPAIRAQPVQPKDYAVVRGGLGLAIG